MQNVKYEKNVLHNLNVKVGILKIQYPYLSNKIKENLFKMMVVDLLT